MIRKWLHEKIPKVISRDAGFGKDIRGRSSRSGYKWWASWYLVYFESRSLVIGGMLLTGTVVSFNAFRRGDTRSAVLMIAFAVLCAVLFFVLRTCAAVSQIRRGPLDIARLAFESILWLCWGLYFLGGWWRPITESLLLFEIVETILLLLALTTFAVTTRPKRMRELASPDDLGHTGVPPEN